MPEQGMAGKPFSSKHLIVYPDNPDTTKSVIIYQRHIHPPHFEVVSSHPSETWPVFQGRNNLFQALVLFVYCVKSKLSGYLDQMYLGNKHINLLSVVDK